MLPTYLRIFVPVEALVSEGALSLAQVEVSALFLLEFHPVVAQQPLLLLFGVDPVLGRADVVRRHAALGTSSETNKMWRINIKMAFLIAVKTLFTAHTFFW